MEAIKPQPGGFRETQWFMAAQDPDHIENIENVVPTDLEGQYKNSGEFMDTQTRQQFSLNVSDNIGGVASGQRASNAGDHDQRVGTGPNKAIIGVVVVVVLGAVAFLKDMF